MRFRVKVTDATSGPFNIYVEYGNSGTFILNNASVSLTTLISGLDITTSPGVSAIKIANISKCCTNEEIIRISLQGPPEPTPTPSVTPTRTPIPSVSATPGVTPTRTPSVTPSVSSSPFTTPSPTPTRTPTPTPTPTPVAGNTSQFEVSIYFGV